MFILVILLATVSLTLNTIIRFNKTDTTLDVIATICNVILSIAVISFCFSILENPPAKYNSKDYTIETVINQSDTTYIITRK